MKQTEMKQPSKARTRPIRFLVVALLAGMFALSGNTGGPRRVAIVVNSSADTVADDGVCTLREAITAANSDTASGATAGECAGGRRRQHHLRRRLHHHPGWQPAPGSDQRADHHR